MQRIRQTIEMTQNYGLQFVHEHSTIVCQFFYTLTRQNVHIDCNVYVHNILPSNVNTYRQLLTTSYANETIN